ncbi:MAG: peptidyl-prolyl cis-trans isomerase [marine bacterium B5-7]|nr:MAG: peptidyl-prolyl cis-trans isomerase [marine bacterium B5-7]
MIIKKNTVVEFDYRLSDGDGEEIENTADSKPMAYLHGHSNLLGALEEAMEGHTEGDAFSVEISPERGFGYREESRTQRVSIKHLRCGGKLLPGKIATVNTDQGARQVVVLKVGRFNADVDLNHPFAGLTLVFDVNIVSIRDASEEEIEHGHAHGPGGHSHE